MNPANKNVKLPQSYIDGTPSPKKLLSYDTEKANVAIEQIMAVLGE